MDEDWGTRFLSPLVLCIPSWEQHGLALSRKGRLNGFNRSVAVTGGAPVFVYLIQGATMREEQPVYRST